jgi:hypothetical protein
LNGEMSAEPSVTFVPVTCGAIELTAEVTAVPRTEPRKKKVPSASSAMAMRMTSFLFMRCVGETQKVTLRFRLFKR